MTSTAWRPKIRRNVSVLSELKATLGLDLCRVMDTDAHRKVQFLPYSHVGGLAVVMVRDVVLPARVATTVADPSPLSTMFMTSVTAKMLDVLLHPAQVEHTGQAGVCVGVPQR